MYSNCVNIKVTILGSGTGSKEYSSSCPWFAITYSESVAFRGWREYPLWTPATRISHTFNFISIFQYLCEVWMK